MNKIRVAILLYSLLLCKTKAEQDFQFLEQKQSKTTNRARFLDVTFSDDEDDYYEDPRFPIRMPTATASFGSPPTPSRTSSRSVLPTPSPSPTFVPSLTPTTTPTARLVPPSAIQIQLESVTDGVPDEGLVYTLSMTGGAVSVSLIVIAVFFVIHRERQKRHKALSEKERETKDISHRQSRSWSSEDSAAVCAGSSDYRTRSAVERIRTENPGTSADEIKRLAQIAALHSNMSSFILPSHPQPFAYLSRKQQTSDDLVANDLNLPSTETNTYTHTQMIFGGEELVGTLRFQFPTLVRVSRDEEAREELWQRNLGARRISNERESPIDSGIEERGSENESLESEHSKGVWVVINERISTEDANNSLSVAEEENQIRCSLPRTVLNGHSSELEEEDEVGEGEEGADINLPGQATYLSSAFD